MKKIVPNRIKCIGFRAVILTFSSLLPSELKLRYIYIYTLSSLWVDCSIRLLHHSLLLSCNQKVYYVTRNITTSVHAADDAPNDAQTLCIYQPKPMTV